MGLLSSSLFIQAQNTHKGEITLKQKALYPEWRTHHFPNNRLALVNPQPLYAPTTRDQWKMPMLNHHFQLSQDKSFEQPEMELKKSAASFFVPPKQLANGKWFWRVRINDKSWSETFSFTMDSSVWKNTAPSADVFVNAIPVEHPRVLVRKSRWKTLIQELKGTKQQKEAIKHAKKDMDVTLPKQDWAGQFFKDGNRVFQNKKFPADHLKAQPTGTVFKAACHALTLAYIQTGDQKYGHEAVRWASRIATFELMPPYKTEMIYNIQDDFSYSSLLEALTYVYDTCYDLFTQEERKAVFKSLSARTDSYYRYFCNRLENRVMDNHAWQHTYLSFLQAAMALKGDSPLADEYLRYAYDVWQARHPVQSIYDGGWNNGKYFGVNIGTWSATPLHFEKFTGHNFYDHPWYKNHIEWNLYKQPPGSHGDGFGGDGYEVAGSGIGSKAATWLNVLATELNDPLASWLASTAKASKKTYSDITWLRVSEGLALKADHQVKKPKNMPQSKIFKDTGIVNMNRDILNSPKNLMVSLRSAPWGGFGHNLSNHNAFTVVHKGAPLFVPFRFRHGGGAHTFKSYRHTRGHNSVLVNGKGQPISSEAYGWIPRFLDGKNISYASGDASNAYAGTPSPQWLDRCNAAKVDWKSEMGAKQLTRFRRHTVFLRPSLILIYDELEASEPVRWDWMLHCRKTMSHKGQRLTVEDNEASVDLIANIQLTIDIHDEALVPPFNVDGRGGNPPDIYKSIGTHAYVTPKAETDKLRLLAMIQVGEQHEIKTLPSGERQCGKWIFKTELSPDKPAQLKVRNTDNTSSFTLNTNEGKTQLIEIIKGKKEIQEAADSLPLAAQSAP